MAIVSNKTLYTLNSDLTAYEEFDTVDEEVFLTADVISNNIYSGSGSEYNIAIVSPLSKRCVRVYKLNNDETFNSDISEYISSWNLNFEYSQGQTRSGNLTIMNFNGKWNPSPVNNTIWKGTRFKIEIGLYYNSIVFWKDCGIYVAGDLSIDHEHGTIDVPIYDKFALLDGTVSGKRASNFEIPVGTTVKAAILACLTEPKDNIGDPVDISELTGVDDGDITAAEDILSGVATATKVDELPTKSEVLKDKQTTTLDNGCIVRMYLLTDTNIYYLFYTTGTRSSGKFVALTGGIFSVTYKDGSGNPVTARYRYTGTRFVKLGEDIFDTKSIVYPVAYIDEVTPYTISQDENGTMGDIICDLAEMISCDVYYDIAGHLTLSPGATTNDDLADRAVLWNYDSEENFYSAPTYDINFSELYNQIIVAGSIENGRQYKAILTNDSPKSQMNIHLTEPSPLYIEDANLVGDSYCLARAKYEMIVQGRMSVQIKFKSIFIPHLECNYLVFLTNDRLGFKGEKFVINSISIDEDGFVTLEISSIDEVSFSK